MRTRAAPLTPSAGLCALRRCLGDARHVRARSGGLIIQHRGEPPVRQHASRRDHLSRPDLLAAHLLRSGRASNPSSKPVPAHMILYRDSALTSTCDVLLSQAVAKAFVESTMPELSGIFGMTETAVSGGTASVGVVVVMLRELRSTPSCRRPSTPSTRCAARAAARRWRRRRRPAAAGGGFSPLAKRMCGWRAAAEA